jgi:hypothetical protein
MLPEELRDKELIIIFQYRAAASGCGLFLNFSIKGIFLFF